MNPQDALPQDFYMYFDRTWMRHLPTDRIVYVRHERDEGYFQYQVPTGRVWHGAEPHELECWFPRAGSYNNGDSAVFIGRRARRNMKKSASDHYFIQWGNDNERGGSPCKIIAKGQNFLSFQAAREILNRRVSKSVAISTDLILSRLAESPEDNYQIIYRGTLAGQLIGNIFNPIFDGTPAAKRAELKLVQEGVECI